ncbi:MAG: PKD-like domain-containing protein [Bacteroidia bacterium]
MKKFNKFYLVLFSALLTNFAFAQVPTITSFSPTSGPAGTQVVLTGTNFHTGSNNNVVYFGAARATVTGSPTVTSCTVIVPSGATYDRITIQFGLLTGYSDKPFIVTTSCPPVAAITSSSFDSTGFATSSTYQPQAIALADYDCDGLNDMAIGFDTKNYITIRRNTSTIGNISSVVAASFTVGATPKGIANGDLNGDGLLDAVIYNTSDGTISVMENTTLTSGNIIFNNPVTISLKSSGSVGDRSVCIGDLDGDGKPDIIGANGTTDSISILRNVISVGNATINSSSFASAIKYYSGSNVKFVNLADIDGDGKTDIVTTNTFNDNIAVFRNLSTPGTISFASPVYFATGASPYNFAIGDIDLDGKPDIATANNNVSTCSVLRNTSTSGTISFDTKYDYACPSNPRDARLSDLNGDGKPDLVISTAAGSAIRVFKNTGTPGVINGTTFATPIDYAVPSTFAIRMITIGDIDGDSRPDILSTSAAKERVLTHRNLISSGPAMTSASSKTICSGASVNLTLTASPSSGTTYSWIAATNTNVTGQSTTTQTASVITNTLVNNTTSPQTVTYTVTPASSTTCNNGTPQPQIVTITINPKPLMTSASSATVCSGTAVNLALTANVSSTYNWIAADNSNTNGESLTTQTTSVINNTISHTLTTAQSVIYTVTPTSVTGGCVGSSQTVTVTVNPLPSMTSANTATVCSGVALNIPLSSNLSSTYSWIAANNANTTGESTTTHSASPINDVIINSSTSTQSVIYSVTPTTTLGSCSGSPQTVTVSVFAAPSMTSANSETVCSGAALNIPLTSNVPANYSWLTTNNANTSGESTTAQGTSTINNTITNTSGTTQTLIYTVTPTSTLGSCVGSAQTVTVTSVPTITLTANGATICAGQSTTLLASGATSYSWNTGAATNTISVNPATTTSYTVTGTSSGCSASKPVTVTVNPLPSMTSANTATICSGGAVNIPLTSSVASTYTWIAANNANTSGESITTQTTSTLNNTITHTLSTAQTVIYSVTPTSTLGCMGSTQTVSVTINPLPTVTNTLTTQSVCSEAAENIPLTSNITSTFSWLATDNLNTTGESTSATSGSAINNTITSTITTATSLVYTVTPTSSAGCTGATKTFTVTVNPKPSMTSASSKTICSGSIVNLPLTSSSASTFDWIAASNINASGESTTTQTSSTINNTLTVTNSNTVAVVYTVTPTGTAGACVGNPQIVTVNLDYAPASNAGKDSSICTGNVVLYGNNPSPGTGIWAMNSKTNLFTTVSVLTPTAYNSGASFTGTFNTNDKVTLKWTITSPLGTCPVTTDSATFTKVNCPLSANFIASGNDFCLKPGDSASVTFTDNSSPGGYAITSYTWTFTGGNPSSYIGKTPPVIKYPYSAGVAVHPVTLQITDANSASSTSPTQNITTRPKPYAAGPISGTTTVCQGQSNVSYSITPVTNASSYAWVFPSGVLYSTNNIETTNFSTVATSGFIKVVGLNTSCGAGDTSSVYVNVNPLPAAAGVITGTNTVCQGVTSVPFSVGTISSATTYTWTFPTGVTFTGTTTNVNADFSTSAQSGLISVYGTNACGTGAISTLSITVNPLPSAAGVISGSLTVCQNQTGVSYSVALVANATNYLWNFLGAVSNYTSTANTALYDFSSSSSSAHVFVTPTNACGNGTGSNIAITVNSIPSVGAISGSVTVCEAQSGLSYSVASIAGATGYNWIFPSGTTITSGQGTNSVTTTFGALSGSVTVSGTNSCGTGSASTMSVTVTPLPDAASLITGATSVCQGQSGASYFVNPIANASSYVWTSPAGSNGIVSSNNFSVNYSVTASSGNVTVNGVNSCGMGAPSTLAVIVNPLPSAPAFSGNTTITLCPLPDSMLFYFAPALNATQYNWQLPSGAYVSGSQNDNDSIYVAFNSVGPTDSIKVASVNGCGMSAYSYQLLTLQTLPVPSICMVSVDSTSTYNEIYWDKSAFAHSVKFHLYRDTANNNYGLIGIVPFDSLSMFKDANRSLYAANGDPNVSSWRYKMAVEDSCGNMSAMSPYHQTMFMQDNSGNFIWNQYQIEGQTTPISQLNSYLFERDNNSTGVWNNIQTLSASSTAYTDPNYSTYQMSANWRSETQWTISCTPTYRQAGNGNIQSTIVRAKSNITNNRTTDVKIVEHSFNVYPNPASGEITIKLNKDCKNCSVELYNSLGQVLLTEKLSSSENKINVSEFENGIYYLKLNSENKQQLIKKVIVQH